MRTIIILTIFCSHILSSAEIPILRFDDKISWKQVFDDGFRPKHLPGLERNSCICDNQKFFVSFKDREHKLKIGPGRVKFSLSYNDVLQMIWHQGSEALTLEEGKIRADEFRKLFDGFIVQEMTMPAIIDPSGLVDAGNDQNNIKARVGEYLIWYGFDDSFRADKPIIPHFYIAWSFPGKPDVRSKDSGDVVRPPEGYEWYSLDPKISTPDPGSSPETTSDQEIQAPVKTPPSLPKIESNHAQPIISETADNKSAWIWWLIGSSSMFLVTLCIWRWRSRSTTTTRPL